MTTQDLLRCNVPSARSAHAGQPAPADAAVFAVPRERRKDLGRYACAACAELNKVPTDRPALGDGATRLVEQAQREHAAAHAGRAKIEL